MEKDRTSTIIFIVVVLITAALLFFLFWKKGDSNSNKNNATNEIKIGDNYIYGPDNASITMIEFSEYQCPYCKKNADTIAEILEKYPQDIKYIFRDFPLDSIHANSRPAAYAAEAAGKQGKYHEYHDLLFEMQDDWANLTNPINKFIEYAKLLNLDIEKFQKDMDSQSIKDNIDEDLKYGQDLGITGVPVLYINGSQLMGAQTFEALEEAILENLAL